MPETVSVTTLLYFPLTQSLDLAFVKWKKRGKAACVWDEDLSILVPMSPPQTP